MVAPVTAKPVTAVEVPVEDNVLIALLLILMLGDVFAHVKPITAPPVPVELRLLIMFELMLKDVAEFAEALIDMPVIAPCPPRFVMVFDETVCVPV